ncbi:MAG: tetratricopeptide repeat protein [Proteobacteria bacterium]|nr:tetratricopeptide repeat protein [Pseudomonadota bacterium]
MRKSMIGWLLIASLALCSCASDKSSKTTNTAASAKQDSKSAGGSSKKATRSVYNVENIDASAAEVEMALKSAESGNVSTAITTLKNVTSKNPKAFLGFYNLGILQERQLDYASARTSYENALRAEPKFSPALLQLARIDIRNGNPGAAISTANQYITANPDVFEHNYAKLEGMIASKQYDDTIALIRVLLKQDEANSKLRYYLAETEFERGRYRLAEFIIGESLEIDPDDYEALFMKAKIHDALSEEDVALIPGIASTLDQVLKLNPDHLEALWMRGNIYYEASNYQKAEEYFRHIISLNPSTVGAYINLANTLKTLDRGPEAEELLKKAKSLDPKDGLVDFALGTLYLNIELIHLPSMKDMDRLKLARTQFENAQKNWSSKEDVALAKGYIRTTDDAIETLQAMLDAQALFGDSAPSDSAAPEKSAEPAPAKSAEPAPAKSTDTSANPPANQKKMLVD